MIYKLNEDFIIINWHALFINIDRGGLMCLFIAMQGGLEAPLL